MSLGVAIFLSALFLGTVALYIFTKDRWKWKKIVLWISFSLTGLIVIVGSGLYTYKLYVSWPTIQTSLWGIQLGASPADVRFLKGEPTERENDAIWRYQLGSDEGGGSYWIRFKTAQVRYIMYEGPRSSAPSIAGVNPYDSIDRIEGKLGQAYVSRSRDDLRRLYTFEKFNIAVLLAKGEITSIGIVNASTGPMRLNDEAP